MIRRGLVLVPVLLGSLALVAAGCGGATLNSTGSGGSAGASGGSSGGSGGNGGSGATGGSGTGGSAGSGGGSCSSDKDCPGNEICGFWQHDGCAAKGSCFAPGPLCAGVDFACLCNGETFNIACVGLPGGYVPAPVLHDGPCADGGAIDGGSSDSGSTDSGAIDGGAVDSGSTDSGSADGGSTDSGSFDSGTDSGSTGGKFACGSSLSCNAATQYCKVAYGGACCSSPTYNCESLPAACVQNRTCACMKTALPAASCSESNGGLTMTYMYP